MNMFGTFTEKVVDSSLETYDPYDIIHCLSEAKTSNIFSLKTRQVINKILKSIEPI
jgi:hypothetical protein